MSGSFNFGTLSGAGDITLTAPEATPAAPGDDVVNFGFVESTGGDVIFDAGDNVVLQSGSVVKSDVGAVTFTAGVDDNDGIRDITLDGTVSAAGGLTLTGAGLTSLDVGLSDLGSLTTDAAGTTVLNGGSVTTTGAQTYNDAVTLGADTMLTSTGSGDITLASTLNGAFGLTVNTAGILTFGGVAALASLTTDAAGTTALNGGSVTTAGYQTYNDAVTLGVNTTLTSTESGNLTFASTLDNGGFGLDVSTGGIVAFNGAISGSGTFTQEGTGTTTLAATNLYSGATTVNAGTLFVDGTIANSTTTVNSGGTLGGHGTLGAVTVNSGGHVAPGNSPGILTTGNFTLNSGSSFDVEINGPAAGTQYDQIVVNGSVTLAGSLSLHPLLGFNTAAPYAFTLIANDGSDAVNGTFAGLAEGATVALNGQNYRLTYHGGDGNDVVLAVQMVTVNTAADTVDSDPNVTSLREAINFANTNAGTTINFANSLAGQTIIVGSSGLNELPLILGDNTVIDGDSNNITVSGDNTYRVFFIGDAGQIPDAPGNLGQGVTHATIEHLTIAHANAKGGDGGGGGAGLGGALFVSSKGSLTLSDVVLASNAAAGGAGGINGAGGGMGGDGGGFLGGGGGFGNAADGGHGAVAYSVGGNGGDGAFTGGGPGGSAGAGVSLESSGGANGGGGGGGVVSLWGPISRAQRSAAGVAALTAAMIFRDQPAALAAAAVVEVTPARAALGAGVP